MFPLTHSQHGDLATNKTGLGAFSQERAPRPDMLDFERRRGALGDAPGPQEYNTAAGARDNLWNKTNHALVEGEAEEVDSKPVASTLARLRETSKPKLRETLNLAEQRVKKASETMVGSKRGPKRRKDPYRHIYDVPDRPPPMQAFLRKGAPRPKPSVHDGPGYNEAGTLSRTFGNYTRMRVGGSGSDGHPVLYEELLDPPHGPAKQAILRLPVTAVPGGRLPDSVKAHAECKGGYYHIRLPREKGVDALSMALTQHGVRKHKESDGHHEMHSLKTLQAKCACCCNCSWE